MQCQRCRGLMLGFILDKHPSGLFWIWGWRCVNCGKVLDPRLNQDAIVGRAQASTKRRRTSRLPVAGRKRSGAQSRIAASGKKVLKAS